MHFYHSPFFVSFPNPPSCHTFAAKSQRYGTFSFFRHPRYLLHLAVAENRNRDRRNLRLAHHHPPSQQLSWSPKQFDCFGGRRKRGDLNGRSPFVIASRFRRWQRTDADFRIRVRHLQQQPPHHLRHRRIS